MRLKKLLQSDTARNVCCWLAAQFIRFVHMSGHWQTHRGHVPDPLWRHRKPFILCFWHGRLMMMPYCWPSSRPIRVVISEHRDGLLLARMMAHFDIPVLSGSSSRGGARVLRQMITALRAGDSIGFTPDGPRGPRMRVGDGIIAAARLAGVPIVPVAYSTSRGRILGSWDHFLLAWPFGRGAFFWGQPVAVARHASAEAVEAARRRVEAGLNAVTEDADRWAGRPPVHPAPVSETGG
jgi:hypothetical protein